jgi:hypothetical protein
MPVAIVVVLKTQEILTAMTQAPTISAMVVIALAAMTQAPTISAMVVIALAAMTQALRVARIATFQW